MSEFINIIEQAPSEKTKRFLIQSKNGNATLGYIRWYAPWRKYCYYSIAGGIFDVACMLEIVSFINKLTLERRLEQQNKKQS